MSNLEFKEGDYLRGKHPTNRERAGRVVKVHPDGRLCVWSNGSKHNWNEPESVAKNYRKCEPHDVPVLPVAMTPIPPAPPRKRAFNTPAANEVSPVSEPAHATTAAHADSVFASHRLSKTHPVYRELRLPQALVARFLEEQIAKGLVSRKSTLAIVPPGYGKTLMASIYCHHHIKHFGVKFVIWVAPRLSLCDQVQAGFHVPERGLDLHLGRWEAGDRVEQVLTDGSSICGFVVTNQTSMDDLVAIIASFGGQPFVAVFDEFHHLKDEENPKSAEDWTAKANFLGNQKNMVRRLLMSGTPWRHDGYGLPYLSEHIDADGRIVPDILATRRQALIEQASLPLEFILHEFVVSFDWKGRRQKQHLSDINDDSARAYEAFLRTDSLWQQLVECAMRHWFRYREEVYPSRLIVVCASQDMARLVQGYLKTLQVNVALAISDESTAHANVREFRTAPSKDGIAEALVTCQMAHEGLDVPDVSHIVYLQKIQTTQFFDQCFARATRVDRKCGVPYEKQRAIVFAPAIPEVLKYVAELNAEVRDIQTSERGESAGTGNVLIEHGQRAKLHVGGGSMGEAIEGDEDGLLTLDENETVKRMRREFDHMMTWPPREILRLVSKLGRGVA